MSNLFSLLILICFQLLLILVPITWTTTTSELFEFPKMLLVYTFTTIITGLWLARMVTAKKIIFTKTPLFLPLLLFFGSQLLSTLFSIDIHTSLFGYYSRFNGGLLSILAYCLLYFAAVSNLDFKSAKVLIKTLLFSALVSSLYAFPEHFGHSPSCIRISHQFHANCWVQDVQTRVFGTFGQPNWLAAFLVGILPLPLFAAVYSKETRSRLFHLGLTLLMLAVIIFTKSQSGLGATAIALFLSFVFISLRTNKKLLLSLIPIAGLVLLLQPAAVTKTLTSLNYINPFYSTTAKIVAQDNLTRVGGTDSMIIRRIVWEGAWKLAVSHPLFGTGVETFGYSYYNVRPAIHNLVSEWDFLYNKAHNEFLNYAATTGFLGLITYLYFLSSSIIQASKANARSKTGLTGSSSTRDWTLELIPALLSGFIALCVSNFFGFSTVPVQLLLYLFPAIAYLLTANRQSPTTSHSNPNKILLFMIPIACLFLLHRIYIMYAADSLYAAGKAARQTKSYETALAKLQQAVKSFPTEPVYTDELALTVSEIAPQASEAASEAASAAVNLTNQTLTLNRVHLNFYKSRTKIFVNLSPLNPAYAIQAATALDAAIRLAPTDAKLWYNRGLLTEQLGYATEAAAIFRHALELKSDYGIIPR